MKHHIGQEVTNARDLTADEAAIIDRFPEDSITIPGLELKNGVIIFLVNDAEVKKPGQWPCTRTALDDFVGMYVAGFQDRSHHSPENPPLVLLLSSKPVAVMSRGAEREAEVGIPENASVAEIDPNEPFHSGRATWFARIPTSIDDTDAVIPAEQSPDAPASNWMDHPEAGDDVLKENDDVVFRKIG